MIFVIFLWIFNIDVLLIIIAIHAVVLRQYTDML